MNYKEETLKIAIEELSKHAVPNIEDFKNNICDMLNTCNNDGLLEDAIIHWYTNNNTLEVSWSFGSQTYFKLFFQGLTTTWKIRYGDRYFSNKDSNGQDFFQLYEEYINNMEEMYKRLTSKLETTKEFYYELKKELERYIASLVHNTIDKSIDYCLGINRDNFRPIITSKEALYEYDVYSLNDYLSCYSISHKDKCWEILDTQPLYDLAKRYITSDCITETYESRFIPRKRLSLEDFREAFIVTFRCYLNELDHSALLSSKYLKVIPRTIKYLGIRNNTNRPVIGIIETLDNCDVYELGQFVDGFKKERGQFVRLTSSNFNTGLGYQQLENRYYHTYPNLQQDIVPFKTAEETKLKAQDYIQVLYDEFREKYNVIDLRIEYYLGDKYIYIPKNVIPFLRPNDRLTIQKERALEERAKELLKQGKGFMKRKEFQKAVEELSKCIDLNTFSTKEAVDNLLSCYRKINDRENERRVALYAYNIAPLDVYKSIIDRLDGASGSMAIPDEQSVINKNLGLEFERELHKKPEYTFNVADDPRYELKSLQLHQCLSSRKKKSIENKFKKLYHRIGEIQYYFQSNIGNAKEHEKLGNTESAILIYERMIAEGCYITTPYERLIIIYNKMKRKNDCLRVLELGIRHFEDLESRQWAYVQYLTQKYNAQDKLNEELEYNGKVGSWYPFVNLYQKYPIVQKWKERLSKISQRGI